MHPFAAAARLFAEQEMDRLPDLSGAVVLVPHHHVVGPFLSALRSAVDLPVFLPPRLLTLPALAAEHPGDAGAQTPSERLSALFGLLRGFDWIAEEARWPMAFELLELIDEMDSALLSPPEAFADFEAHIRALSRRLRSTPLTREAELVFQVWRAFQQGPASPMRDYAQRLSLSAKARHVSLYTLGLHGLSRLEARFLGQCALHCPLRELPVALPHRQRVEFFQHVWPNDPGAIELRGRAEDCARVIPISPLAGKVMLHGADNLEAEAGYVARHIRAWLAQGMRRIGVIALDRLAARRLRAVLERDNILMQDETGWTFSTTVVSHVLDRFFALLEDDFYYRDLLDLLKSHYLFADADTPRRYIELPEFERALNRENLTRGLAGFQRLARREGLEHIAGQLSRLAEATGTMAPARPRPLAEWLKTLLAALETLGVLAAWERDSAGVQLLSLLRRLSHELARDTPRHSFEQWRTWLDQQLDRATFQERDIDSPIRLTHLNAARLRDFEAVVVLGADAAHLPAVARTGPLSEAVRVELGLPGQRQARELARSALVDVLGQADTVVFTWQRQMDGSPNSPSPWLETLEVFHRLAYGDSLHDTAADLAATSARDARLAPTVCPSANLDTLPERLSASGWQTLVDCPYRFFARYGLRLGEADEAVEAMEKRQYGDLLHRLLARFHTAHPVLSETPQTRLRDALTEYSDTVFAEAGIGDYLVRAWRQRWEKHLDIYLEWALAREARGFLWQQSEATFNLPLALDSGRTITLHGRLDRLDAGPNGAAVVDYKAQTLATLRAKVKLPGEDVRSGAR
ncbi:MAG: PD-(D/E)XK nuclease family protein [Hydrogenophilales bacterium]|nr:PD-(D/E)XK nuclease family protein [Hydrogenophilales bacterium]